MNSSNGMKTVSTPPNSPMNFIDSRERDVFIFVKEQNKSTREGEIQRQEDQRKINLSNLLRCCIKLKLKTKEEETVSFTIYDLCATLHDLLGSIDFNVTIEAQTIAITLSSMEDVFYDNYLQNYCYLPNYDTMNRMITKQQAQLRKNRMSLALASFFKTCMTSLGKGNNRVTLINILPSDCEVYSPPASIEGVYEKLSVSSIPMEVARELCKRNYNVRMKITSIGPHNGDEPYPVLLDTEKLDDYWDSKLIRYPESERGYLYVFFNMNKQ